jgi:outer membrane protein with beta-barrel domain
MPILKVAILISYLLLVAGHIYGQENNTSKQTDLIKYYPKPIVSKIELLIGSDFIYPTGRDIEPHLVTKFGLITQVGFVHEFNPKLEMAFKFSYEHKGAKQISYGTWDDPPGISKSIYNETFKYVTITFLPRYLIGKEHRMSIGIGPYFSYLANIKIAAAFYVNDSLLWRSHTKLDPYLNFKKYDFGLTMEAGYTFEVSNRKLCVQALYNKGLIDINEPMVVPRKNQTFALSLGLTLNKKIYDKP